MSGLHFIGAIVSAGLCLYLLAALLKPEMFE